MNYINLKNATRVCGIEIPSIPRKCRAVRFACAFIGGIWVSLVCCAESTKNSSDTVNGSRRTWGEVKEEIDKAFDDCYRSVRSIVERRNNKLVSISGSSNGFKGPTTSVLELRFKCHPSGRPAETVVILDLRIERDYSAATGTASPFRIVRYIAKDEGEQMLKEIIALFENRRWPYQVFQRKKDPNAQPAAQGKITPVF